MNQITKEILIGFNIGLNLWLAWWAIKTPFSAIKSYVRPALTTVVIFIIGVFVNQLKVLTVVQFMQMLIYLGLAWAKHEANKVS